MLTAANNLESEKAALLRDQIKDIKRAIDGSQPAKEAKAKPVSYAKSASRENSPRIERKRGGRVEKPF